MTFRRACVVILGVGLVCAAASSLGQELDPAMAITLRKDGYREMGAAYKNLTDELRTSTPIAFMVQRNAATLGKTTKRVPNWFPTGSGPGPDVKTAAKAVIWTKRAEFDAIQRKAAADSAELAKLVAAGDMKAISAQAKLLGRDCESCHDRFRERED